MNEADKLRSNDVELSRLKSIEFKTERLRPLERTRPIG